MHACLYLHVHMYACMYYVDNYVRTVCVNKKSPYSTVITQ